MNKNKNAMLVLLISSALLSFQVLGAPTNCDVFCNDQQQQQEQGNFGGSSYSSYAKSSYDHRLQRISSNPGTLGTNARLENLDENVIGNVNNGLGLNLDRPGNWQDEKHYVTDDGKGQMSYKAGQTVTNNGYSKFAQHSYSYGSHDSHAPLSNSQILSTAEFNRELQSMRQRIDNFMGSFHLGVDSVVNANLLADFKNKASIISGQLNDVCNQVDIGGSKYQQMQQMQQQFQQDVDRMQRQMEQKMVFQSSSSSSVYQQQHYPVANNNDYVPQQTPAPIKIYQKQQINNPTFEENVEQQRLVEEKITKVQQEIGTFYTSYNRPDVDSQYQINLNGQAEQIIQKLANLKLQAIQYESARTRIEQLKSQFESYLSQLRERIQEIEDRRNEEEVARIEAEAREEKLRHEENLKVIEQRKLRIKQQEEENRRLREEAERAKQLEEETLRQREEAKRIKLQEEAAAQKRYEELKLVEQVKTQMPPLSSSGTIELSGKSTYEHTIKQTHYGSNNQQPKISQSYTRQQQQQQPIMTAHVDMTALTSRMQQELNRLQNEISNFHTYNMRLTAANSQSIINEADHQADSLRQSLNSLCETSGRYQNQNIQTSAEELSRRFEEMVRSLQSQAANYGTSLGSSGSGFAASAGYESHSSYGSSGSLTAVHQPTITNVEYEHSKSTDVEISKKPISSGQQRYSSGQQQQVDCVEHYTGQPCVEEVSRRYRRQTGGK